MEILNNILIKNVRRFGENVDIKVGPGATIFYAPNGTGKTSIFEAIELALTGAVKRLDTNLKPLIRDNCTDSSIELNFVSGKRCLVRLKRGDKPVLTGDHSTLFGKTPSENVPYLLRLTHLLNQRSDGWFVQSASNNAGIQLDYLSIGREAAQANKVITSAKRAANSLNSSVEHELSEAKNILNNWLTLLDKRNSGINLDPTRPLIPYTELFKTINFIAQKYEFNKLSYGNDISLIKSQRNEVVSILERRSDELRSRAIALDSAQPMTEEFPKEFSSLSDYRRTNTSLIEKRSTIEYTINRLRLDLEGSNNQLSIVNLRHRENTEKLERLQSAVRSEDNINNIDSQLKVAIELVNEISILYNNAKEAHNYALNVSAQHNAFFKREVALAEEKSSIEAQIKEIDRWLEYIRNIERLNSLRPDLSATSSKDREVVQVLAKQRDDYQSALVEAQKTFDAINTTNNSIIAAIGIIISEYPLDRGDCPVCSQSYEPDELRKRMNAALNAINPELQKASLKLEDLREKLNKNDRNISIAHSKYVKSSELLRNVDEGIKATQRDLTSLTNKLFPGFATPQLASDHYQKVFSDNEKAFAALTLDRNSAPLIPSAEDLALLKNSLEVTSTDLKNAQTRVNSLQKSLSKAIADSSDEISDVSWEKFNEVNKAVINESASIKSIEQVIENIHSSIEHQYTLLNEISAQLNSLSKLLLETNTNISRYQSQWATLGLQDEPSQDLLTEAKNLVRNNLKALEDDIKSLDQLADEITRWLSFAEHVSIEEEISLTKGRLLEADYTITLTDKVDALTSKHKLVRRNIETLETFSNNLSSELDRIHEVIKSINPLWNKLLKRVVVDPRFSATALNSYSYYKKQHADVNVKLHGEDILASYVASEAQITDLQLTFLLALAQNYEWMPWRALLLDDPTQHHDLVHASAVFDLLRDYVAEKNFQVLLTTHDQVQAKFFMRKLENDGIPARICTLQATPVGVIPIYEER